jgi:hypothetical protein
MEISLYLVTFRPTFTQFLCNVNNKKDAIDAAMKANIEMGNVDGMKNKDNYQVEIVGWDLLKEILRRDYCYGTINNTVVFDGRSI